MPLSYCLANRCLSIFLVATVASALQPEAQAQRSEVTVTDILRAWQFREKQVRASKFSWKERRFEAKGWKRNPSMYKSVNPEGLTVPAEDVIFEIDAKFSFDGNKYRFTTWNRSINPLGTRGDFPGQNTSVSDGAITKEYNAPESTEDYPQGTIALAKENPIEKSSYVKPIIWTFRSSADSFLMFRTDDTKVGIRHGAIGGTACAILERLAPPNLKYSAWVDPARDCVILRVMLENEGRTELQWDVSYLRDDQHRLWIPSKWRYSSAQSDGSPLFSTDAEMREYSINPKIDHDEFTLEFAPGTYVSNPIADETYIQREGGEKRLITRNEYGATYEQYVHTESGMALLTGKRQLWYALVFATSALVAMVGCALMWGRMRKRVVNEQRTGQ